MSFLSLFRRSSHRHIRETDEGTYAEKLQSERFAVAMIAFCLRHDRLLKIDFIEKVTGQQLSSTELEDFRVEAEPQRQADLLISGGLKFAVVVEFKIYSGLGQIQKPDSKEFVTPKGYGWWLYDRYRAQRVKSLYYTVLDQATWECPRKDVVIKGTPIKINHVGWNCLLDMKWESQILREDLFEALAKLGVSAVVGHRSSKLKIKEMKIAKSLYQACQVGDIINKVIADCNIHGKHVDIESATVGDGGWEFGAYVKRIRGTSKYSKAFQRKLAHFCDGMDNIAWFGYIPDKINPKEACAAIWLYTSTITKAEKLQKMLAGTCIGELSKDPEDPYLEFYKGPTESRSDAEWFTWILKSAANLKSKHK